MSQPNRPSKEQAEDMYYISMWNSAVIEEGKSGKPKLERLVRRYHDFINGKVKVGDFVKVLTEGVVPEQPVDTNVVEEDDDTNDALHSSPK